MEKAWLLNRIPEIDAQRLAWESIMVLVIDGDQRIHRSTVEVNKFFGYVPGELDGQFLEVLIPQEYRKMHAGHFHRYFSEPVDRTMGTGTQQVVFDGLKKSGEKIKVSIWLRVRAVDGVKYAVAKVFPVIEISKP
jgi:hypothetical protein